MLSPAEAKARQDASTTHACVHGLQTGRTMHNLLKPHNVEGQMASWKSLAKAALLADGRIDTKEVEILRAEVFADGRVDKSELEFLADLRRSATSTVRVFTELFMRAVRSHMLEDGVISDPEARWLRKTIFADKHVDADEVQLLKDLKREAKHCGPQFEQLYRECVKD